MRYSDLPKQIDVADIEEALRSLELPFKNCVGVLIGFGSVVVIYQALNEKGQVFVGENGEIATHSFSIPITRTPKET